MAESPQRGTSERFDGLAGVYDRHRPDYPAAALDYLVEHCGLRAGMAAVDIGCGTGISSRQLAARGLVVTGIEPNEQMRRLAEATPCPARPAPTYRAGHALATGLPNECAALVLAAQAFHWFPTEAALLEFVRVLLPGGWVALMWNEQDHSDPLTLDYFQALVRHSPEPAIASRQQSRCGEVLLASPLFADQERQEFPHEQSLDFESLVGRACSASYSPRDEAGRQRLEFDLRAAFERHQSQGCVRLRYKTVLYLGRK